MKPKPPACKGCSLYGDGMGFVPGEGSLESKLWMFGEAGGENEAQQGRPFVGAAGNTLNQLMARVPLHREECYISNIVKCKPPGNRTPTQNEMQYCMDRHMQNEIDKGKPDVVVLLGNTPLQALLHLDQITLWRGSTLTKANGEKLDVWYVPTLHPSHVMRARFEKRGQWKRAVVVHDLRRAKVLIGTRPVKHEEMESLILFPNITDVQLYFSLIHKKKIVSIDIETTREDPSRSVLVCFALSCMPHSAICIPWTRVENVGYWPQQQEEEIFKMLDEVFQDSTILKVFQNANFDATFFEHLGFTVSQPVHDTMLMHHLLYAELPHSLEFLTSIYTDTPHYKSEVKGAPGFMHMDRYVLHRYNARDAYCTLEIHKELLDEIDRKKLSQLHNDLLVPLTGAVRRMQMRGVYVDKEGVQKLSETLQAQLQELGERLHFVTDDEEFNPLSPPQVASLLYDELGLPYGKIRTTNETQLAKLMLGSKEEAIAALINLILQYRELAKTFGSFLPTDIADDGRVRADWKISGTATGRLACRNPNFQNVPYVSGSFNPRNCYCAAPGNILVGADASQLELRILAYASHCKKLIDLLESGTDIHDYNARVFYRLTEKPTPRQRYFAKIFLYGMLYGGTPETIRGRALQRDHFLIPEMEVSRAFSNFAEEFPEIPVWREEQLRNVAETHTITNAFGRTRLLFSNETDLRGEAFNTPIQSTAADHINFTFVEIDKRLKRGGAILQMHDGIVLEVPIEDLEVAKQILREEFERPRLIFGQTVSLPCEVEVGMYWGSMEKEKK